jgi:hypothetical protein
VAETEVYESTGSLERQDHVAETYQTRSGNFRKYQNSTLYVVLTLQAQRLLRWVVRRSADTEFLSQSASLLTLNTAGTVLMDVPTRVRYVNMIIDTLQVWNVRAATLQLQLMLRQASPSVCEHLC